MNNSNAVQLTGDLQKAEPARLSELWAQKYVASLKKQDELLSNSEANQPRSELSSRLLSDLRSASAQAWTQTESLLSYEVQRHQIDPSLIDPWAVAKDVHEIYEKALTAYAQNVPPQRLSVMISADIGQARKRYTSVDPRTIGFVSMQFHYCGQIMLSKAPSTEQDALTDYFKVVDDHLYMPLHRAYEAAANYAYGSPRLRVVQRFLPYSTTIARNIVDRVNRLYTNYHCHTGRLNSKTVRISSLRDVEMFQVYLWTCVLEKNISPITQELFPLCVMLYPTLQVGWELVRQMINLMAKEFETYANPEDSKYYEPYHNALWRMFSPEVFPDML
ncbi:MAG: hypothetical protein AAFW84_15155 [Cyanobacteria bacterium J06635_15]